MRALIFVNKDSNIVVFSNGIKEQYSSLDELVESLNYYKKYIGDLELINASLDGDNLTFRPWKFGDRYVKELVDIYNMKCKLSGIPISYTYRDQGVQLDIDRRFSYINIDRLIVPDWVSFIISHAECVDVKEFRAGRFTVSIEIHFGSKLQKITLLDVLDNLTIGTFRKVNKLKKMDIPRGLCVPKYIFDKTCQLEELNFSKKSKIRSMPEIDCDLERLRKITLPPLVNSFIPLYFGKLKLIEEIVAPETLSNDTINSFSYFCSKRIESGDCKLITYPIEV